MSFSDTRKWNAFWIGSGETLHDWRGEVLPAPYFRQEFDFRGGKECRLYLCGLGYHELRLNGKKVGDCELAPAPTNYDAHAGYLVYDVSNLLNPGRNAVGVVLGNGLYNCHTAEAWHFDKATWRDYPKLLLELVVDGETILSGFTVLKFSSSSRMRQGYGPIVPAVRLPLPRRQSNRRPACRVLLPCGRNRPSHT